MRIRFVLWGLLLLPLLLAATADAAPEVGLRAPDFRFVGEGGQELRFEDYFGEAADRGGRRGVVIAWFPKAFTPG